eukprot:355985-Chlamydomonas_euryale.AAC.4
MRARAQIWSWRSSRPVQPPFPLPRCRRAAFSAAQHRRPNSVASTHATGSSMSGDDTKSASEQRMPAVCNAVCISGDRSCGGNTGSGGGDGGCNWPKACAANAPAPGAHAYATWRAAAAAAALRRPTTLEGSLAPAADAFLPLRRLRRRRRAASPAMAAAAAAAAITDAVPAVAPSAASGTRCGGRAAVRPAARASRACKGMVLGSSALPRCP